MLPEGQYRALIQSLTERRKRLGIPQMYLDEKVGYASGYTGKIEVGVRLIRLVTACELAQALGGELVFRPTRTDHPQPVDQQLSMLPMLLRAPAHPASTKEARKPKRKRSVRRQKKRAKRSKRRS